MKDTPNSTPEKFQDYLLGKQDTEFAPNHIHPAMEFTKSHGLNHTEQLQLFTRCTY